MKRVLPLAVMLLATVSASAEPITVQIGNHGNYGRLVLQLSSSARATLVQTGDSLEINLPGATISPLARVPRNVLAVSGGDGRATITMASGSRVKSVQTGRLLVIDVLDPMPRPRTTVVGTRPNPGLRPPVPTKPAEAAPVDSPPKPTDTPAKPVVAPVAPEPSLESQSAEGPVPAATTTSEPAPSAPDPIRVAASPQVGAVAFRRGDLGIVVFDDRVDVTTDDGAPARATVQQRQGATILTLPLASDEALAMTRDRSGWVVNVGASHTTTAPQTAVPTGIAFQFAEPGRTLTISDPVTGQTLLLGTLRQGGADHTMIDMRRTATGYILLPTWLGLALEVTSDSVDLRASPVGFTLKIPDRAAPGTAVSAAEDNQFAIPTDAPAVLMRQLDAQIAGAASSPPRSRGDERVAAARTMLALGMGAEAQALLTLAANDNPSVAADPTTAALRGIAAVLAQRPDEATGLDNPNLPANGEVALWRSLRDVELGQASPSLGNFWPKLTRYPAAIRQRIGPTVIEAAINDGNAIPPSELDGPGFALARALQKEKAGQLEAALQDYDAVAGQRDERDSVRAAVAATELRLSKAMITPAVAADQIEQQTVRWRGNERELAMRLRVAELRTLASQWRQALESLRQTEALFPETKARVAALKSGVFTLLLFARNETLNPLEIVTIAGDFADCIPDGKDGERLAGLLAEKLVALDLPSRAIPVLQHLVDTTPSPAGKAEFALRLAKLQLDTDDPAKAETVLSSINPDALAPAEAEQRLLLRARARAGLGDPAAAAALLAGLDTAASDDIRAALLAKAGNWPGSLQALQQLAAKSVPDTGDLTEQQQDIVLREATAAVQANDVPAIRDLRRFDARMKPPRADVFRLLTANAVESADDLPRAAQELAMTRALPDRLNALKLR